MTWLKKSVLIKQIILIIIQTKDPATSAGSRGLLVGQSPYAIAIAMPRNDRKITKEIATAFYEWLAMTGRE